MGFEKRSVREEDLPSLSPTIGTVSGWLGYRAEPRWWFCSYLSKNNKKQETFGLLQLVLFSVDFSLLFWESLSEVGTENLPKILHCL